jgi:hypothetical protein
VNPLIDLERRKNFASPQIVEARCLALKPDASEMCHGDIKVALQKSELRRR